MKNIKAIIFDLGAVILNIKYQNTISAFRKLGVKKPTTFFSKKKQISLFDKIETGKISEQEFLLQIKKQTKSKDLNKIKCAWNSMILDLPENRIKLLKELNTRFSIFLLSNTNIIHIEEFKRKIGLIKYTEFYNLFNKVYYSFEIGFRKPDPEVFKLVLYENKLKPNEVLFVDDSIQHINSAKLIGIKTHHLMDDQNLIKIFPDIFL